MNVKTLLCKTIVTTMAISASYAVYAEQYPSKPITMVIPYNAGGGTDVLARALQPALEKSLGQTIVVSNIPGGGGILGFTKAANAKADGYTVTVPNNVIFANQGMGNATYKYNDFDYLGNILSEDYLVAVRADGPWKTWQEFETDLKAHPNTIKFGFSGYGGSTHVVSKILADKVDYKAKQIPYDGSSKAVLAAMGGHVDALTLNMGDLASGLQSGKLRLLATMGKERLPEYPNVPTLKELGYDISLSNWRGIVAPAGVSDEVKAAWNKAIKEATSDKKFIAMMKNQGSVVDYQASGKELDERMKTTALSFIETAQKLKN